MISKYIYIFCTHNVLCAQIEVAQSPYTPVIVDVHAHVLSTNCMFLYKAH